MTPVQFRAIMRDIDEKTEGDAITLDFELSNGSRHEAMWGWLDPNNGTLVLSPTGDRPPLYTTVEAVVWVSPNSK